MAILDAGQEDAVKVSCYFLPSPDNYTLFSQGRAAQRVAPVSQVENEWLSKKDVTRVILGNSASFK